MTAESPRSCRAPAYPGPPAPSRLPGGFGALAERVVCVRGRAVPRLVFDSLSLRVCFRTEVKPMPRLENGGWSCSCAAQGRHRAQPGGTAAGLAAKVGGMLSSSGSSPSLTLVGTGAGSPSTASSTRSTLNWSQHLVQRSVVLFVVGAFMALVLNLLQIQRNVTLFPDEVISTLFSSAWWVPPCCGTAAGESLTPTRGLAWFPLPHPPVVRRDDGAQCVTFVSPSIAQRVMQTVPLGRTCAHAGFIHLRG